MSLPDIFQHQSSGNSFRGAKGSLYLFCPIQIPSKCWGWSNLLAMFPSCSPCQSDFKTAFVFSLALFFLVSVTFLGYDGNFNGKQDKKLNILIKVLSDIILAILIPLFSSNVATVSIVQWSQKLIFVAVSVISGIRNFLEN